MVQIFAAYILEGNPNIWETLVLRHNTQWCNSDVNFGDLIHETHEVICVSLVHSCLGLPALRIQGAECLKSATDHKKKDQDGGQEGCVYIVHYQIASNSTNGKLKVILP